LLQDQKFLSRGERATVEADMLKSLDFALPTIDAPHQARLYERMFELNSDPTHDRSRYYLRPVVYQAISSAEPNGLSVQATTALNALLFDPDDRDRMLRTAQSTPERAALRLGAVARLDNDHQLAVLEAWDELPDFSSWLRANYSGEYIDDLLGSLLDVQTREQVLPAIRLGAAIDLIQGIDATDYYKSRGWAPNPAPRNPERTRSRVLLAELRSSFRAILDSGEHAHLGLGLALDALALYRGRRIDEGGLEWREPALDVWEKKGMLGELFEKLDRVKSAADVELIRCLVLTVDSPKRTDRRAEQKRELVFDPRWLVKLGELGSVEEVRALAKTYKPELGPLDSPWLKEATAAPSSKAPA
jgi:hypothetical protein